MLPRCYPLEKFPALYPPASRLNKHKKIPAQDRLGRGTLQCNGVAAQHGDGQRYASHRHAVTGQICAFSTMTGQVVKHGLDADAGGGVGWWLNELDVRVEFLG